MIYAFFPIMAAMCYGLAFAFVEKAMETMNVVTYMLAGSVIGIVLAIGFAKIKGEPFDFAFMNDKTTLFYALMAILAPAIGWFLTIYAVKNTSASYAAFAEISYPLFTVLFLFLFFGVRHFDWTLLVGGGLIMLGSFILVYGQNMIAR